MPPVSLSLPVLWFVPDDMDFSTIKFVEDFLSQAVDWENQLTGNEDPSLPLVMSVDLETVEDEQVVFLYSPRVVGRVLAPDDQECAFAVFDHLQHTHGGDTPVSLEDMEAMWSWGLDCQEQYEDWVAVRQSQRLHQSVDSAPASRSPARKM